MPSKGISNYLKESNGQTQYNEPLGLLYLASFIRENGFDTSIYDLNTDVLQLQARTHEEFLDTVTDRLLAHNPAVIGVGTFTAFMTENLEIARRVKCKNPDIKVVFGGPHSTFLDEQGLQEGWVDAAVRKEGEVAFLELLRRYERGADTQSIPGTTVLRDGRIQRNEQQSFVQELDTIPHPARDLISSDYYKLGKRMNICSARGCPSACTYCVSPFMWDRTVRFRSAKNIEEEISSFLKEHQGELPQGFHINFVDDTFALKTRRVFEVSEMMGQHKIPWFINTTVNTAKPNVLKAMYHGGCTKIKYGLESANQRVLDLVKKQQTVEMMRNAVIDAKDVGYITQGSFILGSPTETEDEILNTIAFARSVPLDFAFFFISTPYPGTEMSEKFVPGGLDVITGVEKFNPKSPFYGEYDAISPQRKRELLAFAYHDFYIDHHDLTPGPEYEHITDPLERVGYIQSITHQLHKKLGSYSGITNFLGRTGADVPFRNA